MSEKVKITQEQADAIEFGIKHHNKDDIIRAHTNVKNWRLVCEMKPLREMPLDRIIKALYIGYEVEPEFKVGEFVLVEKTGNFGRIRTISDNLTDLDYGDGTGSWWSITDIRHATPSEIAEEKERRWWKKHGRDVWELRVGDLLISKTDRFSCDVKFVEGSDESGTLLVNGIKDEFLDTIDEVKNKYIVLTFTESRLDVKTNE